MVMDQNQSQLQAQIDSDSTAAQFGVEPVPYHTHNGTDSPVINQNFAVTKLSAGSGITITPSDGEGDVTISSSSGLMPSIVGNGVDGIATFDGSTTILGIAPISNTYTLKRDIYCTTITVNSGVTVFSAGYKVFAGTSVLVSGTISVAGGNGGSGGAGQSLTSPASGTGGTAGTAGVGIPNGTIKQPGNGQPGNSGCNGDVLTINTKSGLTGNAETNCLLSHAGSNGADSGKGLINAGTGSSDNHSSAGVGGSVTQTTAPDSYVVATLLVNSLGGIGCNPGAGSGAGGGSGAGVAAGQDTWAGGGGGGGAGAPGGIMYIASPIITVFSSGVLTAKGGNGGTGGAGGSATGATGTGQNYGGGGGGGGGGGNGGLILLVTSTYTNSGTVLVTAGSGGVGGTGNTGGTSGNAASIGTAGLVQQIIP